MASPRLQLACMVAVYVFAFCLATAPGGCGSPTELDLDPIEERYERWLARYRRSYGDPREKERRVSIYRDNVFLIDAINALNLSYKLTDGKFADMTNEEFRAKNTWLRRRSSPNHRPSAAREEASRPSWDLPDPVAPVPPPTIGGREEQSRP